jgi:HlyD family secretion protein
MSRVGRVLRTRLGGGSKNQDPPYASVISQRTLRDRMKFRKPILVGVAVAATTLTLGAFYTKRGGSTTELLSSPVTRGSIVDSVVATGTLEAVTTVQVGSQLSGTVQALYADFNSIVRKGGVIARLEPSLYQSQVDQARATLAKSRADVERLAVAVDDAQTQLNRARDLHDRSLIPQTDFEAAEVALRSADAQKQSAEAQVTQARAALNQAQVNLEKTVITAPIDGFVVSRSVDVGQTVAASLQAPTLFVIAADLTKMQVNAGIDESDIGRVQPGLTVTFHVDAYPDETFSGTVAQVRLNPILQQNVVTYATVISVANKDLKLKPGMTATVNIETARRDDVLRVPSAALRFKPTQEMLQSLGAPKSSGVSKVGPSSPASLGATPGLRRTSSSGAPQTKLPDGARLWLDENGTLTPHPVKVGLDNGTFTELVESDLAEGTKVVTNVITSQPKTATTSAANPLFPIAPGGRGFGGNFGGGGRGGR